MGRAPCCEKVGLKRGRWTAEEDEILKNYIEANGEGSWRSLPKNAGLLRCGKSCRLRWINYLRSDLKRGNITPAEEEIIINLHATLGNRWSVISGYLPGRTDNEIKNYWNSHLSRRIHSFIRRPDPHFTLPPEKEKKNKNKNKNKKKKLDIDKTRPTTLLEKGTDDNNNNKKIVAVSDEPEMDLDSLMEDLSEIWTEMEIGGTMTSSENDWNMCWGEEAEPAAPWSGDMEEQLAEDQNRVLSSNYDYYNFENQVGPLHHDHNQFISWLFS